MDSRQHQSENVITWKVSEALVQPHRWRSAMRLAWEKERGGEVRAV